MKIEKKEQDGNDEMDARTFTISKCPANIYDEFIGFARKETGNNYAMAIKILLEKAKEKERTDMMLAEIRQARNDKEMIKAKALEMGD